MKQTLLPFLFSFVCFVTLNGQDQESAAKSSNNTTLLAGEYVNCHRVSLNDQTYLQSYWIDAKHIVTHPFRWTKGEIIAASAVVGGTVGLLFCDKPINDFFVRNQTEFIDQSSKYFFDPLGSGIYSIPALGLFYISGMIWKNDKTKETALKGVEAYVLTAVFTTLIKQVSHRHRPYQDEPANPWAWEGPFRWDGPEGPFDYNSFPSGHSSAIWSIATVISYEYRETKWVPALCFSLAGATSVYRLAVDKHWASDVLFGSALGYSIGALVYNNDFTKFQVLPYSELGMGATLVYKF